MILVDVHAHLDHHKFGNNLDGVIENSRRAGVKAIITSGINKKTNRLVLEIAEKYPDIVKCSFGLYPIDALEKEIDADPKTFVRDIEPLNVDEELEWIEKNKGRCVAIGECGLDFHWVQGRDEEQKNVFRKIIAAVEKIKKPIIVHSRKAELEAIEMLESSKIKNIVMHCFSGNKKLIKRAADNGWSFSIPPVIVRLQHFQLLTEMVNINQLLTETDAPYLSPYPDRINEPAFVAETIKKIAEIKGFDIEETANSIYLNYKRMFE